ncbi:MAG: type II secretion system inner membrane protein GspF [Nitrospirae bacterium]|nr:type II secretion system inner membrane protein GspF [Nitrospirota bacterium]
MPVFEYKGLDTRGKALSGMIDADTVRIARQRLKEDGIYATELVAGKDRASRGSRAITFARIRPMEVALLTRQLATLVGAGLPMLESLTALVDQVENPRLKSVVADVREQVKEGSPLSDALTAHPKVFSHLYVSMVRAGEASGTLGPMLVRLAEFSERQVALQGTVMATMTYPILMVVMGGLILGLLMTFVVPRVTQVFEGMHQALPTPTVVLIAASDAVRGYWWLMAMACVGAWLWVRRWAATEEGGRRFDRFVLGLPVAGKLVRMVAISRFTRTLSTLLAGGIPLLEAMAITQQVVLNKVLEDAIENARENIKEGESIAKPLAASGVFPPMVTHMIAVGEATGELEAMLVKVSESYDREVETTIGSLTSILSPIMILVMGGAVFAIVMAILLPIVELSGVVG